MGQLFESQLAHRWRKGRACVGDARRVNRLREAWVARRGRRHGRSPCVRLGRLLLLCLLLLLLLHPTLLLRNELLLLRRREGRQSLLQLWVLRLLRGLCLLRRRHVLLLHRLSFQLLLRRLQRLQLRHSLLQRLGID